MGAGGVQTERGAGRRGGRGRGRPEADGGEGTPGLGGGEVREGTGPHARTRRPRSASAAPTDA